MSLNNDIPENNENLANIQYNKGTSNAMTELSENEPVITNNPPARLATIDIIHHTLALPEDKRIINGYKFDNLDLRNEDLTNIEFTHCSFYGTKLGRRNLEYLITLYSKHEIDLRGIDMEGEDLSSKQAGNKKLGLVASIPFNLSNIDLSGANFSNCNLSNTIFKNSILRSANLSASRNVIQANFDRADMYECNLKNTNISAAQLSRAANLQLIKIDNSDILKPSQESANKESSLISRILDILNISRHVVRGLFSNLFLDDDRHLLQPEFPTKTKPELTTKINQPIVADKAAIAELQAKSAKPGFAARIESEKKSSPKSERGL